MPDNISSKLKRAWNAFMSREPPDEKREYYRDLGTPSYSRPDRPRFTGGNERSLVNTIYNRIAVDCSSITIEHVRLDKNRRFSEVINSGLNNCLTVSANKDQTGRALIQDIVQSMFDEGVVAIVPVDKDDDVILSLRTAKVVQWYPDHVRLYLYNDRKGVKEEITLPKTDVAIVENPFYAIMNEPNSTIRRLSRKLSILDAIDEQSGSSKLDLIIQLPYSLRTDLKKQQAAERKKDIEEQLYDSKYGIAYLDSTEHITQLNRPINNNLMDQIKYLTELAYSQLGITQAILDGTAGQEAMLNYNNRVIEPIISAIVDSCIRTFLTKTARSQGQSILAVRDPFKLVPAGSLAEIADKFTRNEIMSANEIRQIIGLKPSSDPKADELRNRNLNATGEPSQAVPDGPEMTLPVENGSHEEP